MNRTILIILLSLVIPAVVFAQINWTEHTIAGNSAHSVYAIDLDDDLDVDVLGASGNAITWWENGGNENFTEHTIAGTFNGAQSVFAIDLDGDLDVDVLGAAQVGITWWENDGSENFTEHSIDPGFTSAIYAIDLDDDNDIDVLSAACNADDICWWENDGNENFTKHTIDGNFDYAISVYAIDLDGDLDVDVLGAARMAKDITWWENDGNENFTKHTIDGDFDGAYSVFAIDLDGDLDVDVLGAARTANDITWWENDGEENFTKHTIADNFEQADCVFAIDLDDDNDIDVLGAAFVHHIAWWENDGNENFTEHTIDGDFVAPWSVYAIDLDDDLDVDVLGAGGAITWWENEIISYDVGTISIDIPSTVPEDTTLNPHATVTNFGANSVTFSITCTIEPGAYTSTTVSYLAPGDSIQVTFPDGFQFAEIGMYTVTVYTQLVSDECPGNDTLEKIIETQDPGVAHDVGTVAIDIPDTISVSTTLNPHATVANFSINPETFSVTCTIEPGAYTSTTVSYLAPGDSTQVTFPDEFTFESGIYTVTVYTLLVGDENTVNDTLEKMIVTYDPGITEGNSVIPTSFSFGLKNNPAKGKAAFNLALPEATTINLRIYDVTGRLIDNLSKRKSAGQHEILWNKEVSPGVYFYSFESSSHRESGKLVIIH
jgi:archaellum component FlaF (FlaF/FlaG flagellin family)